MKKIISIVCAVLLCTTSFGQTNAEKMNALIGRGINMGNCLDAPSEGEWGETLKASYFTSIAAAGFNSVRIPIRWSAHTSASAPYTIDETFVNRVKWAIDQAFSNKLVPIINVHHFNELFQTPAAEHDRFVAIWTQVSEVFKGYSDSLVFEILNEPNTNLTPELWNTYLADAMAEIRKTNATRVVMIGSAEWGGVSALSKLKFPAGEQDNVILTVHYYEPFHFTHQGASWVVGSNPWLGTTWDSTAAQVKAINDHFNTIKSKANELGVPVNIGEFGSIELANMASRVRWTSHCARTFERLGFSWNYWAFGTSFGAYNTGTNRWNTSIRNALIPLAATTDAAITDHQSPTAWRTDSGIALQDIPASATLFSIVSPIGQTIYQQAIGGILYEEITIPSLPNTVLYAVFTGKNTGTETVVIR